MAFDNKSSTTSVPVTKRWVGPEGGPVTVRLLADGVDTGKTLTLSAEGGWAGSFDGLAKHVGGRETAYAVSEDPVEGCTPEVSGDAASGFTVTNTERPKPDEPDTPDEPTSPDKGRGRIPQAGDEGTPPVALLALARRWAPEAEGEDVAMKSGRRMRSSRSAAMPRSSIRRSACCSKVRKGLVYSIDKTTFR